ncbi:MAG: hypothetical protein DMF49_07700, partial [Acidobacteria bacterium]
RLTTEELPAETSGGASGAGKLVPLRDRDGRVLALARVEPVSAVFRSERFREWIEALSELAIASALISALLALPRPLGAAEGTLSPPGSVAGICVLLLLLAALRLGASPLLRDRAAAWSFASPETFAVPAPFGLLSSPADLFLSSFVLLIAAHICTAPFRRRRGRAGILLEPPLNLSTRVGLGLIGAAGLALAISFIYQLPSVSRINPIRFQLLEPEAPRLALQASALALTAAALMLLLTALSAGRAGAGREAASLGERLVGSPSRFRFILAALATVISGASLIAGGERASRLLVEQNLQRDEIRLENRRDAIIGELLKHAETDPRWSALSSPETHPAGPALAFDYWSRTELAVDGLKSALSVLDRTGHLRSEFTYNLPPGIYKSSPTDPPDSPRTTVREDAYSLLTLRIPLLRGETPLRNGQEIVGRLVVQLSREPDNLTFFMRNDPLVAALFPGGRDPIYDEYLGGEPVMVLYSLDGKVIHSSALRPPSIPTGLRERLGEDSALWGDVEIGGRAHSMYYFLAGKQVAAIGYPAGGWSERLSAFVRFAVLAIAGALALRAGLSLAVAPRASLRAATVGWLDSLRVSYSRRLLAALMLASMLPLLGLSAYIRAQVLNRTSARIETEGITVLETARRLLEDYLEASAAAAEHPGEGGAGETRTVGGEEGHAAEAVRAPGQPASSAGETGRSAEAPEMSETPPARIGDDALFWLSRVVRQELSVFVDGRLAAASRPDLYATGLLSRCLDAEVAQQVLYRRAPYALREQNLGTEKAYFIYAPIDIPDTSQTGVLAVPLTKPQREQRHEADVLGEGLLTATALLGALLAAIAFATSRRISGPIRDLTQATARLAEGDYSVRLPVKTKDETGMMVDSFNKMAKALEGQRRDLRRRADYIEKILLNATTGVISIDPAGYIRTINPAARLMLDLGEDAGSSPLPELFRARAGLEPVAGLLEEAASAGDAKIEREVDLPAGPENRRLRCVILPLREEETGNPGRIVLLEDLTEIVRSNRLAAWAEMARSIAHEIKNPLTPIQLSAEHLLRLHREADPSLGRVLEECVSAILAQVRELREISAEFSSYASLPALQPRPADAAAVVRESLHPYRASPPPRVRIEEDYGPAPAVLIDPRVLRRALVNLIDNALQAMPAGGTLRVRVAEEPPGSVKIEISDTGEGMDEATLGRMFEPYFSTRATGTGLGMAIARRAVEEHGGTLTARSRPGSGTVMTITLPASTTEPARRTGPVAAPTKSAS